MSGARAWLCLWPGLAPLWLRGSWVALLVAMLFAVALNYWLAVSLIWHEILPSAARQSFLAVLAIGWAGSGIWAYRWQKRLPRGAAPPPDADPLAAAQTAYLRGHWIEAEQMLRKIIDVQPRDVESRLLLASLYRHTGRVTEATVELRHLERMESAVKWQWEIAQERGRIAERASEANDDSPTNDDDEPQPAPDLSLEKPATASAA